MKKPILAAVGLAGACVACCTIPIAAMVGGLSAAGLAGWVLGDWTGQIAAMALAVLVVGGLWAWRARRAKSGCSSSDAAACSIEGECGCGPKTRQS